MVFGGLGLAVIGALLAIVGNALDEPTFRALGVATFLIGAVLAAVAAVRSGYRFGRGPR